MIRFTAVLIAFALSGSPVAAAVCESWCGTGHAAMGHCHDEIVPTMSPAISDANLSCGSAIMENAFLRQDDRRFSTTPVLADMLSTVVGSTAPPILRRRAANELQRHPPFVLRL